MLCYKHKVRILKKVCQNINNFNRKKTLYFESYEPNEDMYMYMLQIKHIFPLKISIFEMGQYLFSYPYIDNK